MPTEDVFTMTTHHLSTPSFSQDQHLAERAFFDITSFTILSQDIYKSNHGYEHTSYDNCVTIISIT